MIYNSKEQVKELIKLIDNNLWVDMFNIPEDVKKGISIRTFNIGNEKLCNHNGTRHYSVLCKGEQSYDDELYFENIYLELRKKGILVSGFKQVNLDELDRQYWEFTLKY